MKLAMSSGHGLKVRGASGILDEVDEARKAVDRTAELMSDYGVGVVTFHDDTSTSQDENLDTIVRWHNDQDRDLDVSFHLNCYDGSAHGTEVLYLTQYDVAKSVCDAICAAGGFTNRGPKQRTNLAFLNGTDMPAILLELCFVDSSVDANLWKANWEKICQALANLAAEEDELEPVLPEEIERPESIPVEDRPTLARGDQGSDVLDLQRMLPRFPGEFDGDFGSVTEDAVLNYQRSRGLAADGIVGEQTWTALYEHKLPVKPPPLPPNALSYAQQTAIMAIANNSAIADYSWKSRGIAPTGFTQGMALSFAQTLKKFRADHPAAIEMAKARTDSDKDVLNLYRDDFEELGFFNEQSGEDTLRHLYAFMLGSGMRESSGQHCCGRDQSAENTSSDTCEAGAFQTSYNAHSASDPEFDILLDEYAAGLSPGYLDAWSEGVSCSSSDWENYGSGRGEQFQDLCKNAPAFSAETHALTLRNLANHYGPVIRHEVELHQDAEEMFRAVQDYLDMVA